MKRTTILLTTLAMLLIGAVGLAEETVFAPTDSRVLVACFSATGRTWSLAQAAAEHLNADLWRIEPEVPYTDEDLNYTDDSCRANQEMADETSRPALAATVENMAQYDTVVLAFPIWWGQAPRIIETFIEAHDLSGKTVITFCTSGSSGYGRTGEILSALTDDTVNWIEGARFAASASAQEIADWLGEKGVMPNERP